MTNSAIITSLLDTDLYKLTMGQFAYHSCSDLPVEYTYKLRKASAERYMNMASPIFVQMVRNEIDAFCHLTLTQPEADYLSGLNYLKPSYIQALRNLRLNPDNVHVAVENGYFTLRIAGTWFETILFEVPVLAIISEVYYKMFLGSDQTQSAILESGRQRLKDKIAFLEATLTHRMPAIYRTTFDLVEFGTRRRYSHAWQKEVIETMLAARILAPPDGGLLGTSNVAFACEFGLKPFGTMAHEFLQAHQALAPLHRFQAAALRNWNDLYRGNLGIALTDVVGIDAFLRDFDLADAKLYDGVRHDSGDPYEWFEKVLAHYTELGIDAQFKTAVFSDGLNFEKALAIHNYVDHRMRAIFGIGTFLTNDMGELFASGVPLDVSPLNHVIKLTRCDGQSVAKLSDSPGKAVCTDEEFLIYLSKVFKIEVS